MVNRDLGKLPAREGGADRAGRRRGHRRQARRPLPALRLADRLGHPDEHERQRGHLEPGDRDRRRRARDRRRRSTRTTTSTCRSRRTTRSRPRCTSPRSRRSCTGCSRRCCALRDALAAQGRGVRRHREDRPHAPAGRGAAHARPGVLRLRRAARRRPRAHRARRATGLYELAIGGTAVGTGLNTHPEFADACRGEDRRAHRLCRSRQRAATSSRRSPRTTTLVFAQRRAHARSRCRCMKIANDIRWLGSGSACRPRRADPARERARLVDHAGQGEPDAVRGA